MSDEAAPTTVRVAAWNGRADGDDAARRLVRVTGPLDVLVLTGPADLGPPASGETAPVLQAHIGDGTVLVTDAAHGPGPPRRRDGDGAPVVACVTAGADVPGVGWGVREAVTAGATLVAIDGASTADGVVGAVAARFGWARNDWDELAGATVAGLLLAGLAGAEADGPVVAEVAADGSCTLVAPVTPGADASTASLRDAATACLLAGVDSLDRAATDATVRVNSVHLTEVAPGRLQAAGTRGLPLPERSGATGLRVQVGDRTIEVPPPPTARPMLARRASKAGAAPVSMSGRPGAAPPEIRRDEATLSVLLGGLSSHRAGAAAGDPNASWVAVETSIRPLAELVGATSASTDGPSTLGVWARSDEAYDWLAWFLTVDRLRELVPGHVDGSAVLRLELPNLRALSFALPGTVDPAGLAAALMATEVDIPRSLT